ncbi:MAG TPA: hypothetical protein DDW49_00785 [Deltaproteobacteria bacterium]|nr:MAG: hypothetical protein A2048_03400 [Deltaproteobacteria bacterium GWA2_45_12]HBF11919.1 hypothetical protein [Deltaproteobacteria bacterium]
MAKILFRGINSFGSGRPPMGAATFVRRPALGCLQHPVTKPIRLLSGAPSRLNLSGDFRTITRDARLFGGPDDFDRDFLTRLSLNPGLCFVDSEIDADDFSAINPFSISTKDHPPAFFRRKVFGQVIDTINHTTHEVVIVGNHGTGKSTLLKELETELRRQGHWVALIDVSSLSLSYHGTKGRAELVNELIQQTMQRRDSTLLNVARDWIADTGANRGILILDRTYGPKFFPYVKILREAGIRLIYGTHLKSMELDPEFAQEMNKHEVINITPSVEEIASILRALGGNLIEYEAAHKIAEYVNVLYAEVTIQIMRYFRERTDCSPEFNLHFSNGPLRLAIRMAENMYASRGNRNRITTDWVEQEWNTYGFLLFEESFWEFHPSRS